MAKNRRICASCGTPNEEDARFCEGCGASLARACATCGVEASATARFCRGCGSPLDDQIASTRDLPAAGPVRKTVTVMFADLAGSTTFEEQVDAETARDVMRRYHTLLRSTVERHLVGLTKFIGDGFMAVWGVPEIGPDDAAHAVEAAAELQERFVDLATETAETHGAGLALRVAVNTGEVVVGAGDADLVGDALNVGARLEAECPLGRVVVGDETWRSTRGRYAYESLGQMRVKGRTAPVAVYLWLGCQSETADSTPFVGRADEVQRLQTVLHEVTGARAARLVTIIGDPGVGKTRLATEFVATQNNSVLVEARCDLHGAVALAPIVDVLRGRDIESDIPAWVPERERLIRDLNGLTSGVPGSVEENFWALRRFVEVLARNDPVLLVIDDIHWADTLLLDFIEHLIEWVQNAPVLVLALARPELREIHPDLVTVSRWVSAAVHLGGLNAGATAELAVKVLGATKLPDELLRRLPSSTGGNPLFVRELIGMLAHDGVLVEQPSGWRLTIDVEAITIPPTIHALLASRLEGLDAADRRVLEVASVIGSDFSLGNVRALVATGTDGIKLSLNRLRRLELAQPSGSYIGDEPVWRFHHVLIRDVAYRRLLKSERAHLHERFAAWIEAGGQSVAFDSDEMAARHLEAAHTYRRELGLVDEHANEVALRSAHHYAASARRALDRDELISAGRQAARGAALANADPALHAELLLICCEAFLSAGDVVAGAAFVDDLERIADERLAPWATCYRCQFVVYTAPERLLEAEARLQDAIHEFNRRADATGLAKAHRVRASARLRLGRVGAGEVDLFEALIAARQSGDHRQITAALVAAPGAALWGPSPVPKAGGRCLDVVRMHRMTTAAPSLEATSLRHLAVLELLRGRPDKARSMLADARQAVAELGLRHGLMETELFAGIIESMEGDPVASEPHFRTALEGLDAMGVGADAGQAAALLARTLLAQGRLDEADRYAAESERLAGRNLKTAIAWRAVRAEILSARGCHSEAGAMARDAVAVAGATDLVLDHAEACLALSRVLAAAGDVDGANAARDEADRLYTAKEVSPSIGRPTEPVPPVVSHAPVETRASVSRLGLINRATQAWDAIAAAVEARDADRWAAVFADQFVYDDRRKLAGNQINDRAAMRASVARAMDQYNGFESRTLAVRGDRLHLAWSRLSNGGGLESTHLHLHEVGDHGRVVYVGCFDEDDFEGAYRELDRRYYAGEGVAFADCGVPASEAPIVVNGGEFDRFVGELCTPDLQIENRSRSALPDRAAGDLRSSFSDLNTLVASARTWVSAVCWLSPTWSVTRMEREAAGHDGEQYAWTRLIVCEHRDRRLASMCEFDLEDEPAAFAYAEERMRVATSRLAVRNRASRAWDSLRRALRARDADSWLAHYSESLVYDDRRRLGGNLVEDFAALQAAVQLTLEQCNNFESRTLAVRGDRLHLTWSRCSNDAGFETTHLHIQEISDDARITYEGRFDEDDFEGAYRELERRYYAGKGAAFAECGVPASEATIVINRGEFDRFVREFSTPDLQIENRSRSPLPDRAASGLLSSFADLNAMVASARTWGSAVCWLSPTWSVTRMEREAAGHDGEQYAWTRLIVCEHRDRRLASMCEFDLEDEQAAFAYAEERMRVATSRLAVRNRASETVDVAWRAMQAHDVDGAVAIHLDRTVYDDRRRLSGGPIESTTAFRAASERILEQYPHVEWHPVAVRGERLELCRSRWWDDAGNEATYLHVWEVTDDGRIAYHGRFDDDDFEGAYRTLEERYYVDEGAAFAEAGATTIDLAIAYMQRDLDRRFGELAAPDFCVENRSRSLFGDRSAAELRTTFEKLNEMVASVRMWSSAVCWMSPNLVVRRLERDAVGRDSEPYGWSFIDVAEIRNGRIASSCLFDVDDEEAAFAYAEERMRSISGRLPSPTDQARQFSR